MTTNSSTAEPNKRRRTNADEDLASSSATLVDGVDGVDIPVDAMTPTVAMTTTGEDGQDLLTFFQNDPPLPLRMLSFLSAVDTVNLLRTNQTVHKFIDENEDEIFQTHLVQDFCEGRLLMDAFLFSNRSVPCPKSLYHAFFKRFRLQKECPKRVAITWQNPITSNATNHSNNTTNASADEESQNTDENEESPECVDVSEKGEMDDDINYVNHPTVDSLMFIVRVSSHSGTDTCGFLGWKDSEQALLEMNDVWYDWVDPLDLPTLKNRLCRKIDRLANEGYQFRLYEEVEEELLNTYRLTVHVVNIETCQVMTLLDDSPGRFIINGVCDEFLHISDHAYFIPQLYGLPPRGSPYFRRYSEEDFLHMERSYEYKYYPAVENLGLENEYTFGRCFEHSREGEEKGLDDDTYLNQIKFTPSDVSSLRDKHTICSYLRALMDEKCTTVSYYGFEEEETENSDVALPGFAQFSQPQWVRCQKILDVVLSFTPLEDQTTFLRGVCKAFDESIIRQLQMKVLDQEWLPIAFRRFGYGIVFRADMRRGWSNEFNTRESIIDWTLLTMGCRCKPCLCADYRSCPDCTNVVSFKSDDKELTMDVPSARRLLEENGQFELTADFPGGNHKVRDPSVQISISHSRDMNLYTLCDCVYEKIRVKQGYGPAECWMGRGPPIMWGSPLQRDYGLAYDNTTMKKFFRSIFLAIAAGGSYHDGYFQDVKVATSDWCFDQDSDYYSFRMKTIYRFRMPNNEKVEIVMEKKSMFRH